MPPKPPLNDEETWTELKGGMEIIFGSFSHARRGATEQCRKTSQSLSDGDATAAATSNEPEIHLSTKLYMSYYTHVYNYCTKANNKQTSRHFSSGLNAPGANLVGESLYSKVRQFLKDYLKELLAEGKEKEGTEVLEFFRTQWELYLFSSKVLDNIFKYLDRHWVKREREEGKEGIYDIDKLALVEWRDELFLALKKQCMNSVIDLIERDRRGQAIDTMLISGMKNCCVALGTVETVNGDNDDPDSTLSVYKDHFQSIVLETTAQFYARESSGYLSENPVTSYMKKAEDRIKEEENRVNRYLHESTKAELAQTCIKVMIRDHASKFHLEFAHLLADERVEDLKRMYELLLKLGPDDEDGLGRLRVLLEDHVKKVGLAALEKSHPKGAKDDPKAYVTTLLEVHGRFKNLMQIAFANNASFCAAMDKAFRVIANKNCVTKVSKNSATKSPELIAKYCNLLLKKSSKGIDEDELESTLSSVMVIFNYLEDKDVFQKYYQKLLASRLLEGTSRSEEGETNMISKLKRTCGLDYTAKLQRMFNDVRLASDEMSRFKTHMGQSSREPLPYDVNVLVIGVAHWPIGNASGFRLPHELSRAQDRYDEFYKHIHNGRKLSWVLKNSRGEIKTTFLKKTYIFQASTFQMAILLQYNNGVSFTRDELLEGLLLSTVGKSDEAIHAERKEHSSTLDAHLKILNKAKILVEENGRHTLNMAYKNKKLRMNINVPIKKEKDDFRNATQKDIEEDRKIQIQACLVRVMKSRKVLELNKMIVESTDQLRDKFTPKVSMIKRAIDYLVEKEYFERSEDNRNEFKYLA